MRRGEVRLADLVPVRGSEATTRRPVVVVSNDRAGSVAARLGRGVITVVPVASTVDRVYPFPVVLPADATGLRRDSEAQAEQVRMIDVRQLGGVLGHLPADLVGHLDDAVRLHLQL